MGLKEEMMLGCWGAAGAGLDLPGESPQQAGHPPRLSLGLHFKIKTAREQQELQLKKTLVMVGSVWSPVIRS